MVGGADLWFGSIGTWIIIIFFTVRGAISKWRSSVWIPPSFSDRLNEGKKITTQPMGNKYCTTQPMGNNETMKHDSDSGANGKTVPSISAEGIQTL